MKFDEMQKPLVQSALVLLAIFVVIGFVAGSGAESFLGGIVSIIKGVVYSVLFAVALVIALIVSVVLLIAIFLGAISLYSSDKAKDMFATLKDRLSHLFSSWAQSTKRQGQTPETDPHPSGQKKQSAAAASLAQAEEKFAQKFAEIKKSLATLKENSGSINTSLSSLWEKVSTLPGSESIQRLEQIEAKQEEISSQLAASIKRLDEMAASAKKNEEGGRKHDKELDSAKKEIQTLAQSIEELRGSIGSASKTEKADKAVKRETSVSFEEGKFRIFTYLNKEADKKQFSEAVDKAIAQKLTYRKMDEFFSQSLPKKVDAILKKHPSLTKEYIRARKNG